MYMRSISLLFLLVAAGCAASAKSQSAQAGGEGQSQSSLMMKGEPGDEQDVSGHSQCLDDDNRPLQCERDSDCCAGFYCGRDPQVSDVIKVCISSGA